MILTTGPAVEGRAVNEYLGVISAQAIPGIDIGKDLMAGLRNIAGGRSGAYEGEIAKAITEITAELDEQAAALGADAVISVDFDDESVGTGGILMVAASGTAVNLA